MEGLLPGEKKLTIVPTKGAFTFNNLHVKYEGRFGFCTRF